MNTHTLTLCTGIALLTSAGAVAANDVFQVLVEDQTMTWGADTFGYMQVQDAGNWQTQCEFSVYTLQDTPAGNRDETACTLTPGTYNVINHTTRQRIHGVTVGELDGIYTAPMVDTVDGSWVVYDPYQVIQANSVYSELNAVPTPAQLSAQVYSSTAAELFWNRADVSGLHYDIYLADQLLGNTNGTSYFLSGLPSGETLTFTVIGRDSSGRQSSASTISVQTPNDGSNASTALSVPAGLRASVYSSNTLELFWDRQGPGQLFEVYDSEDELLTQTDGTSYFAANLPPMDEYRFSVRAIDDTGNRSEAASIAVTLDTPDAPPAISMENAENLLKEVVRIANRAPFEAAAELAPAGVDPVLQSVYSFVAETDAPDNGLTLIEGTAGGLATVNFGGLNGGQYVCNAGGSANALSVYGGEDSQGYKISLDDCVLPSGTYSGIFTRYSGGRSGYYGNIYENTQISPADDSVTYRYDGASKVTYNRYQGVGADTSTATFYSAESADGDLLLQVTDFDSAINTQLKQELGSFLDILYGDVSATISFSAQLPDLSASPVSVSIELAYTNDPEVADPVGLWNSGYLSVTADDGSSVLATLDDTDADATYDSIVISVGEDQITRPLNEGYLVSCRVASFDECSP